MKKIKITGVAMLSIVLLTAALATPAFASEDATEDIAGTVNVQEEGTDVVVDTFDTMTEEVVNATVDETAGEGSEIHYTTGGSAVGREEEKHVEIESEASIMGVTNYIVPSFASIYVGQSEKLELCSGTTSNLIWTSSNNSVATVDATGKITGLSKGFAVVRATDVSGNYDSVKVFVGYYVGADLDSYQGTLDAYTLVNSGIDFAIIRRGYGNLEFTNQLDKQFERTYGILKNAGIPVGTYLFNYFESTANAVEEAENLYPYIKDLDLDLGVYSDFEEGGAYSSYEYYKTINGKYPTPAQITEMNTAFLETLKSKLDAETPVGYYSSMSQCANWYSEEFLDTYPLWAAYWRYRTNDVYEDGGSTYSVLFDKVNDWLQGYSYLTYNMVMHQYSSEEFAYRVGGNDGWLDVDVIDMNSPLALRFVKVDATVSDDNSQAVISWNTPNGANNIDGYIVYRTVSGITEQIATVDSGVGNSYTDSEAVNGAVYTIKAYSQCGGTIYYSQDGNGATYLSAKTVYKGVDYSAVYDFDFYYNRYSDLRNAFGTNEAKYIEHFVNCGMSEGRQAKSEFNVNSYKNRYEDLRRAYGLELKSYYIHYMKYGKKEGRNATGTIDPPKHKTVLNGVDYSAVYDMDYYYGMYSDLRKAFGYDENKLLEHFVKYGMNEGRRAKSDFIVSAYKGRYGDLRKAFGDNTRQYYMHYINYGKREGRKAV